MELQLALALSNNQEVVALNIMNHQDCNMVNKKRTYDKAFDDEEVNSTDMPRTLPLFVWKPNGEDEREKGIEKHAFHVNKDNEDENSIIGWPPIESWRKKLCYHNNHLGSTTNYVAVENRGSSRPRYGGSKWSNPNSIYVKVKMEGVGIARKVDLSLHHSFQTLTHTLIRMFGKCQETMQAYKLTYQDTEGDWLLAADISWGTFIRSVQQLKLLKNVH